MAEPEESTEKLQLESVQSIAGTVQSAATEDYGNGAGQVWTAEPSGMEPRTGAPSEPVRGLLPGEPCVSESL